jgi:hypothetical protein
MESRTVELVTPNEAAHSGGIHVVAIGGGTGLSTLLKGLKRFVLWPKELPCEGLDSPAISARW